MSNPLRGLARPEFLRDEVLSEIFEASVQSSPDKLAVIDGEVRLSYRELKERADAVAGGLVAAGIGPGDVVGLWMPRGSDLLTAQIAITTAGAAWPSRGPSPPTASSRC